MTSLSGDRVEVVADDHGAVNLEVGVRRASQKFCPLGTG